MRGFVGVLAGAALLLAMPNCSGDDGGGASGSCSQFYDAFVGFYQRCNGAGDLREIQNARSRFLSLCANALAAPGAGNLASTISSCSSRMGSISCDDDPDCTSDVNGTLPDGAACLAGYQCVSGGCSAQSGVCGTCVPTAGAGQPCSPTTPCARDLSCTYSSSTAGVCENRNERLKVGEACGASTGSCERGLHCSYQNPTAPVCAANVGEGSPCPSGNECVRELRCKERVCAAPAKVGEACDDVQGCASGLACGNDRKCATITFVAAGEACDLVRACAKGRCKGVNASREGVTPGVCEDPVPDGAACLDRSTNNDAPRCDLFAQCVNGTCQMPNPSLCK